MLRHKGRDLHFQQLIDRLGANAAGGPRAGERVSRVAAMERVAGAGSRGAH